MKKLQKKKNNNFVFFFQYCLYFILETDLKSNDRNK